MFVAEYGPLFWAEKYVPSGIVSVLAATIPIITLVLEMLILRQQKWRAGPGGCDPAGICAEWVFCCCPAGRSIFPLLPCLAILCGCTTWSLGIGAEPLDGSAQGEAGDGGRHHDAGRGNPADDFRGPGRNAPLAACLAARGRRHAVSHRVWIVAGVTAFVWLLAHMPATRVSSHAYVNPIVAVALGYFAAGEPVTMRTLAGTALVLVSVFMILRRSN